MILNQQLISIIIPVFNAGATLKDCIESVVQQTYKNIELLIIDGESTDNTIPIINSYGAAINFFISEKDKGIYDAMNKGICAATGDWLLFLGGDDKLYCPEILTTLFSNYNLVDIDFLYGDVEFTSNKSKYGCEKDYSRIIDANICHQAIFYRKKIFNLLGNYNLKYSILADHELNIRIFRDDTLHKKYVAKKVSLFNNKGASSNTLDKHFYYDMLNIFLNNHRMPFWSPQLQQYHFYYGIISLCSRKFRLACKHIPVSWMSGRRKLFYLLFTAKFLLRILLLQKIKIK